MQSALADLSTLFTTAQERQLINSNRYKSDEIATQAPTQQAKTENIQRLVQEEVSKAYVISGISISNGGFHTVWINDQAYEDGGQLEDQSRIKVMTGNEIRVRITAPDGKQYFATSGETLDVTYLAAAEN